MSPTSSPTSSLLPRGANANDNPATAITVSICVGLIVVAATVIAVVVLRRRSRTQARTQATLRNIRQIERKLLARAKDTFYQYYGPTFKDQSSETEFEHRFVGVCVQHTNRFTQPREIARGNGGIVHKARFRSNSPTDSQAVVVDVAIKSCNVVDVAANHRLLVEARLMLLMKHPAIVPLLGIHLFKVTRPWMVTSFMANGDLKTYLRGLRQAQLNTGVNARGEKAFTDESALEVVKTLAGGLAYLSRVGIIHGDIAARNVLCGSPATNVVLSDFGNALPSRLATRGNLGDRYSAAGPSVPFRWMAPEALLESKLSHESDVWSFGVLLWEIDSYGKTPYGMLGYDDVKQQLLKGERLPKPATGCEGLYEMAEKCWCSRPSERITAHDLHQHFTMLLTSFGMKKEGKGADDDDSMYLKVGAFDEDDESVNVHSSLTTDSVT
eukprot:m.115677 g.115677  ORF g.115677 m.115677 type:complete len:440 (-) comp28441_c0_seq1:93-1412(-)